MRTLKLLTALTIALSSSVALADPAAAPSEYGTYDRWDARNDPYDRFDRNVYDSGRYVRWEASRHSRDGSGRWLPLMRHSDADNGRQLVNVGRRAGRLDKLRIESDRGTPLIKRIAVEYQNGTKEVLRVDSTLSRGHGQVIDLPGNKRVARIVVITDPRFDGLYSIYGT